MSSFGLKNTNTVLTECAVLVHKEGGVQSNVKGVTRQRQEWQTPLADAGMLWHGIC
jgi:hypothetical protein